MYKESAWVYISQSHDFWPAKHRKNYLKQEILI